MSFGYFQGQRIISQVVVQQLRVISSSKRLYGRWMHRKPTKVLIPYKENQLKEERIINLDAQALAESRKKHVQKLKSKLAGDATSGNVSSSVIEKDTHVQSKFLSEKSIAIKEKRQTSREKENKILSTEEVFDENNQVKYEKLKENDGRISTLLIKLKSKKERAKTGNVLVEGWRLIIDGIEAKCPLKYVIFSNTEDLNKIRLFLPRTGVKIYKIPYKEIQLWSSVETSSGIFGVFETPTVENVNSCKEPLPINIICDNIRIPGNLGAILRAAVGVGCDKMLLMKGCVDFWDPKVIRTAAGAHFRLPAYCGLEWNQIPSLLDSDTSVFVADSNSKVIMQGDGREESMEMVNTLEDLQIPVLPYYSIEYSTMKSITVIVGGETEGISEDSYRFAAERNGLRINIPLQEGVDSLNTGMATTVILFEIKKQLLEAKARNSHLMVDTV